ncbi:MAG: hypothetical protein V4472_25940 [Pseudomonadota bacterium]
MSDARPMGDTAPGDQPTTTGADFTSTTCGMEEGSALGTTPLLPEGGWLAINGSADLSSCVVGPHGASVTSAYVTNRPPPSYEGFAYGIWVYGQGPSGFGSGWLELTFTDQAGSHYSLKLYSSTPAWHYVNYNSDSPGITEMAWCAEAVANA